MNRALSFLTLGLSLALPTSVLKTSLDEHIEVVEGFMVVATEDEVCFEELIKTCQRCLCLGREGLVVT